MQAHATYPNGGPWHPLQEITQRRPWIFGGLIGLALAYVAAGAVIWMLTPARSQSQRP